ncbi:putative Nitrilase/cyanide hydratase and apolipoprotein N-acyltransferase [Actinacidiphila bryophytorum]|uniref:Nitrilase/cyanide hydratase and apolipoprotein N-acyltransferase n=1 Tax=Actinacidiphila bryophytorum TaxID=1436133 RepID=A0A9W4H668_9ACTN|nr:putative Nitrilase/cyanide hydratase and apolipoprotein N-acyltransferase [Actinacidiphila bryophytorum]
MLVNIWITSAGQATAGKDNRHGQRAVALRGETRTGPRLPHGTGRVLRPRRPDPLRAHPVRATRRLPAHPALRGGRTGHHRAAGARARARHVRRPRQDHPGAGPLQRRLPAAAGLGQLGQQGAGVHHRAGRRQGRAPAAHLARRGDHLHRAAAARRRRADGHRVPARARGARAGPAARGHGVRRLLRLPARAARGAGARGRAVHRADRHQRGGGQAHRGARPVARAPLRAPHEGFHRAARGVRPLRLPR